MNSSNKQLNDRGLWLYKKKKNQVRIGHYGIADIIAFSRSKKEISYTTEFNIQVVELKKDNISLSTFMQAVKYAKGIINYFAKVRDNDHINIQLEIVLIGRTMDMNSDFVYLTDVINSDQLSVSFYLYDYDFDGISFKKIGNYCLIEEGFKGKSNE